MVRKDKIYERIAKKLSGEINDQELLELNNWLKEEPENLKLYQNFADIWVKSDEFGDDFNPDIAQAIIKYKTRIKSAEASMRLKTRKTWLFQSAAAAILLLFFFYFFNPFGGSGEFVAITTDSSGTKTIQLPDSSIVSLNRNTVLEYPEEFNERLVKLTGEAFFEVKKSAGKNFVVETPDTKVEVLGTSFNVKARQSQSITALSVLAGKVQFSSNQKKVILSQNQQAKFNNNNSEISTSELTNKNFLAWKTGILEFNNSQLKEVFDILSENYGYKFTVNKPELYELKLTYSFHITEVEEIFTELEIILPISIHIEGNHVKINALK